MLNRRTFIASGAALAGLGLARPALALAQGKAIRIGYVSPQTGPFSAFSAADAFMVRQFLAAAPGLGIEAEVIVKDSQSNPNRAAEVARELISRDEVNLLLVASTPETTNPVCSVAESEEIPVISTVAPWRPDPRRRATHALIELSGRALDPAGNMASHTPESPSRVCGLWRCDSADRAGCPCNWPPSRRSTVSASGREVRARPGLRPSACPAPRSVRRRHRPAMSSNARSRRRNTCCRRDRAPAAHRSGCG